MLREQGSSKRKRHNYSKLKPRHKKWVIERCRWSGRKGPELSKGEERDWTAMPRDTLSAIFEKVGPINVLLTAQFVCRSWQQAAHDPRSWQCADFTIAYWDVFDHDYTGFNKLVKAAVDRSKGSIEEFGAWYAAEDEDLLYMAQRSSKLKRLRLVSCYQIHGETINKTFKMCPHLDDLDITIRSFGDNFFEDLQNQHWPPLLKRLCLNVPPARGSETEPDLELESEPESEDEEVICNLEALSIAHNMPRLRELQIIGNCLSNEEGLLAILNGCPLLDALDLRGCVSVDLRDEDVNKRCRRIKKFKGPQDSMADLDW